MTTHYVKAVLEVAVGGKDESTILSDLDTWFQNIPMYAEVSPNGTQIEAIFVGQLDVLEWTP